VTNLPGGIDDRQANLREIRLDGHSKRTFKITQQVR
jgi:hypothetical protein